MSKPSCLKLLEQTKELMDETQWFAPVGEDCGSVEGNFDELAARVEKVLVLHGQDPEHPSWCAGCDSIDWPCLTVRLLDGEEP